MVWKPGNDELVEWLVAEWRLGHLHAVHLIADSVAPAGHCKFALLAHQLFYTYEADKVGFTVCPLFVLQGNLFLAVRFRALDKDALNSSHAVSTEVNTLEQVEEMFDSVSYEKVHFINSK